MSEETQRSRECGGQAEDVEEDSADARRMACHALREALAASGALPVGYISERGSPAITVTVPQDGAALLIPGPGRAPALDSASVLHRVLAGYGVNAQVTMVELITGPALRIALDRAQDAHRLAELVLAHLPEPHASAQRLRTVLAEADITAEEVRVVHGLISVGDISAQDARTLCDVLGAGSVEEGAELDAYSWRDVEVMASRLACMLHSDLHGGLSVTADPACTSCIDSRPHRITLGLATPAQAREIADVLQRANTPQPSAGHASGTDTAVRHSDPTTRQEV
ncbi:hypothetical protein [Streptomyces sp. B29(2018)]|uniref:hypothetical protein n=1 Tax=Streptomyces sp. B29(2018) TaxID=2485016 RepID=UPI0013E28D07|nr:hypothetical protein [Streptomyces sp. B29(2018)]